MYPNLDISKLSTNITKDLLKNYKPSSKIIPKIAKIIKENKKFLLTTHISCDLDGVGSQYGLYFLLRKLNKECMIINNEEIPEIIEPFVKPNLFQNIQDLKDTWQHLVDKLQNDYFVFILDSSELTRSALVSEVFQEANCPWSSIDHHVLPSKKNFLVDHSYGATCEIIWDLYRYFNIKIPKEVAIPLYLGLITDTGNFRYNKTSLRTHLAGGELISYGIDTSHMYQLVYENHTFDRLKVMRAVFNKAIFNKKKGYVIGEILPKTIKKFHLNPSYSEGIVNYLLAAQGVYISALLKKTKEGVLKASLRSIGNIDVSKIAKELGGGGHKNASGLKMELPYSKAKKLLINSIDQYLTSYHH